MKLTKLCAIALSAIAMTSLVNATHSSSPCASEFETIDAGATQLYLVNDATGTWIYLEFNNHASLQRGGAAWYEVGTGNGIDDACWDRDAAGNQIADPDFIIL